MIVLDTSVAVAYFFADDADHPRVAAWLDAAEDDLVTTPLVLAEMDHIVLRAGGAPGARALHGTLQSGALQTAWWPRALPESIAVAERNPHIGLADASLVALAAHVRTTRIATLDERHFRALRPLTGESAFTLLPADAD